MRKNRITIMTFFLGLCLFLTGCGSQSTTSGEDDTSSEQSEATKESGDQVREKGAAKDVLVVYFSATGTTKGVAEKIAALTEADIYEIVPAQPYTEQFWGDNGSGI